jgi:hypothetical protein
MGNPTTLSAASQSTAQNASQMKQGRVVTSTEQSAFEAQFENMRETNLDKSDQKSLDFSDSLELSDAEGSQRDLSQDKRVNEHRSRDQKNDGDGGAESDHDMEAYRQLSTTEPSTAFSHPFQLLSAAVPNNALNPTQQARTAACWTQLNEGLNSLLVNTDAYAVNAPAAVLTLNSSLLPNTTLTLVRVPEGWVLQVNSQAFEVKRALQAHAGELEERFAQRNLGHLRVEASDGSSDDMFNA